MMQSVTNRRGISKRLTQTMLLCIFTVAFAMSAFAKNYYGTDEGICQHTTNENFTQLQIRTAFTQNTMNYATANAVVAPCNVGPDVIGGKAFRDFNFNGQQEDLEPAQEGVEVFLFTCDANNVGVEAMTSVVTDMNGEYVFTGLTPGQDYRVEFVIPASLDFLWFTTFGPENGTNVQFTTPGTCEISVGVGTEAEFHQDNPFLAVPCYINGSGDAGTPSGDSLAFLAIEYNAQGENQNIELFTAKEVGSLWGVSYERSTKTIFSSAVMRRHMGFGPGGTGAIYMMDVNDINNSSIVGVIDLDALGLDTGTDPRTPTTLPTDTSVPNNDTAAFGLTAKMSIGDIDISDDGKTLYAVNLFSRELITIDLTDYVLNGTIPGAAQVTSTPIPAFNCDDASQWRPWALNFHNGDLYIGGVCSAEVSQDIADLTSTVVKYDGTNFTELFTMPLDFQRGDVFNTDTNFENQRNQWYPWSDDYTVIRTDEVNGRFAYPQPILSDIEFDTDGSLILGFLDRTAQQGGYLNYGPNPGDDVLYTTFSAGDMIRVCNVNGTLVLEGEQPECTNPIGLNWPQGPNGQEYYWEDQFPANPSGSRNNFVIHSETALGSLALLPGSGDVVATVYDPLGSVDAGGIAWFDNTTGGRDRNYQVFVSPAGAGTGFPGKSNGLGDLELVCSQAPSEIGNYVWIDCNGDGVQDACEDPLPGVNVSLYKDDGTLVATVMTDANGQYYFNRGVISASSTSADMDLEPNTTYYIAFGTNGQYDNGTNIVTINGENYQLTQANAGQTPNADLNDSDAVAGDATAPAFAQQLIAAVYTTPCTGFVNHTIDAGFSSGALILDVSVTPASCPDAADGTITAVGMGDAGVTLEYSLNGAPFGANGTFTGLAPGMYTVVVQPVAGSTSDPAECGSTAMTTVEVLAGQNPNAPVTTNYEICMDETVSAGQGLTATCDVCSSGMPAVITWYDAAMGGNEVGTGSPFVPAVNTAVAGETTFYAECSCGPCVSNRTPATFEVVVSPTPTIVGETFVCPGSEETFTIENLNTGHEYTWEVVGGGLTIVGSSTTESVTVLVPETGGPFQLKVTETGATGTNCMGMDTIEISVKETTLACNNNVQVSLDANGCALITPDIVLEGITGTGEGCYEVSITNQYGEAFGNKVTCENINDVLTVNVASLCEENSCWASIVLEDKLGPTINCPTGSSSIIPILCSDDIDAVATPTATDNCSEASVVLSNELINDDDVCSGVIVTRTYVAIDAAGNVSDEPCELVIIVQQAPLPTFPDDINWGCDQYAEYPNITDATPLAPNVPDFDASTDPLDVPFYIPAYTLSETGSGSVDVSEGLYCNYAVTHNDDTLSICTGIKIVRTWTVMNWCTGELIVEGANVNGNDNVQIIKVVDTQAPFIIGEDFTVNANIPGEHPQNCSSTDIIPIPVAFDKCGSTFLHIYTPIGEANYVNGENANDGASIPAPGLEIGTHPITYVATDDCGNERTTVYYVTVEDRVNPTPVCDEVTDVVLNSVGIATVQATAFDDGSNDNCCIDRFEVKRLTETNIAYSSEIEFDCSEVGDTVMIMMKVVDCYDNDATCTVEVRVEDKEAPTCSVPSDVTISCLTLSENNIDITNPADLDEQFGTATANDNCDADVEELTLISNFQGCGNGFVTRRFLPTDVNGNVGEICEQNILVLYQPDYKLTFPADFEGSCGDLVAEPEVIVESEGCDLIAVSHTDQLFNLSDDGACYKIIRRYEVINWCTYSANTQTVEFGDSFSPMPGEMIDETTFGNAGHLTYTQTLKIVDNIAPVLTYAGETEFCVDDNCVTGPASLPIDIDENCTSELSISWVLDAFADDDFTGEFDALGGGQFTGVAPLGTHRLIYTVEDGCGNASSYDITFEIQDCKAPVAYCNGGVVIDLMDTNPPMVQIWASDLDAGSFDTCGGEVTASFSTNPLDTGLVFTCSELGNNTVEVYFIDEAGNFDYCATSVIIQDNLLTNNGTPCISPDAPVIAGTITTEEGEGLLGATVELNGVSNVAVTTNETGTYTFNDVALDYDYSVNSMHDVDHDNGVTTFDLTMIKSHILSINLLDSPYKMIAADANNSASVTTSDIVALRRLILTMDDELENNTSWRFVDASYTFPNPQDPWETGFPEVLNFNNLSASQLDAGFIAVKIGDVNGNAQANLSGNADERSTGEVLQFGVKNTSFKAGENVTIDVTAQQYRDISSYQFTCDFDVDALEFVGVKSTEFSSDADFATTHVDAGYITVAHSDETAMDLEDNTVVFSLVFNAKAAGAPSDFMQISSAKTTAIAYGTTAETMNVEFTFSSVDEAFALYQNRPNPFTEATEIPFFLPTAGKAKLTVYDVSGKLMKVVENDYNAGYHQIAVSREELGAGSIFYYQLDTENYSATRKMVLIK